MYLFDPSFYETKVRRVYARFKDEAGNIHGIVLPGKTAPYPVLQDKITQDLKTSNGLKISSGKIFQLKLLLFSIKLSFSLSILLFSSFQCLKTIYKIIKKADYKNN